MQFFLRKAYHGLLVLGTISSTTSSTTSYTWDSTSALLLNREIIIEKNKHMKNVSLNRLRHVYASMQKVEC